MNEHREVQPTNTSQIVKWGVILIIAIFPLLGLALGKSNVGVIPFFAPVLIPTAVVYFRGVKSERAVFVVGLLIVLVSLIGWIDFLSSSSDDGLALVGPFLFCAASLVIAVGGVLVDILLRDRAPAKGKS